MKVVLDTNVLVSGLLSATGPCGRIVELVLEGVLQPCLDSRILAEYQEVVHRPRLAIPAADASRILDTLRATAESVVALPLPALLPDPDDLPFLEVAAASAAILVTGNQRHYPDEARGSVTVASPAEFLDRLRGV